MPSSTSSGGHSRMSSSNTARKSTKPSRAMPHVIEIDDSSDDEAGPSFRPPARPYVSIPAGRSAPWPSTSNTSTSNAATTSHRLFEHTRRDPITVDRRNALPVDDPSATEHTSDSDAGQQVNNRHSRLFSDNDKSATRLRGEGGSASTSRAPAASTSREKVYSNNTSSNNRPRTAFSSNKAKTQAKSKRSNREASTSATEDTSADEAPVVATSSAARPRPVRNEIINMTRSGQAAANMSTSTSRRESVTGSNRPNNMGDTATANTSSRNLPQRKGNRKGKPGSRIVPDLDTSDLSSSSDEMDSTSDSSAVTVASSARTTTIRPKRTRPPKRTLEPEVTVISAKRSRPLVPTAGTSAGPSTSLSTRTRGAGLTRTGSTASVKDAKADTKGKGRAPRSSIEPASVTKASSSSRIFNSGMAVRSHFNNTLFPEGKDDDTLVSPGRDIYSESTKINYPNVSKVVTKVVIKPTDLSEELECAICSDIMVSPVNLVCGHTFCEACVTPWLETNKDCPSCRTKMETPPVRSYLADRVIKKYLETIYTSLESEGKHKEAKAARAERATAEKDAEKRRMKAAAEKNRRAAIEQRYQARQGGEYAGAAAAAAAAYAAMRGRNGAAGAAMLPWRAAGAHMPAPPGGAAAVPPAPAPANPRQAGRRAARAANAAAEAAAQAELARNAAGGHALGGAGPGAAHNNANQFGNLLQQRNGALHVDPALLQQTANEMGVPAAQLYQMMFQA